MARLFATGGRIGAFGASGAGKTHFCEWLSTRFSVSLKTEGVREWLAERSLVYSKLTTADALELQRYCLDCCERSTAAVHDRTALDALVYASWMVPESELEPLRRRVPPLLARLDLLVFFPAYAGFLHDDGVRVSDLKHQAEIAAMMFLEAKAMGQLHKVIVYDHSRSMEQNLKTLECTAAYVGRS